MVSLHSFLSSQYTCSELGTNNRDDVLQYGIALLDRYLSNRTNLNVIKLTQTSS